MKVTPQLQPGLVLWRNVGHGVLWGSPLSRGSRAGSTGRARSRPSACGGGWLWRGGSRWEEEREAQGALKKWRDAHVDSQFGVVNSP